MHLWKIMFVISFFYIGQIISADDMSKHKLSGIIQWNFEKRPFCNAFTGCGRKRTLRSQARIEANNEAAEKLSDLIDINAEPAVENVQKQIMSQAKIYEAIKEASKEILIQKNKHKLNKGVYKGI